MVKPSDRFKATYSARMIKICHSYVVLYNYRLVDGELSSRLSNNFLKQVFNEETGEYEIVKVKEEYSGEMTTGSVKRMREVCQLMFAISTRKYYNHPKSGKRLSFRLGFLTMTLSSAQGEFLDKELKKQLLEPYIRKLRKYGLKNYVWKAERQKNGNLHFHMFIDCYIDLTDARNIWNRLQAKLGYIREFAEKYNHHNPNSTDVHPIQDQDKMNAYMHKYMTKPVEKVKQLNINSGEKTRDTGKVWDCSLPLKCKNLTSDFAENMELTEMQELEQDGKIRSIVTDHATVFFYQDNENYKILPESLKQRYTNYLDQVRQMTANC